MNYDITCDLDFYEACRRTCQQCKCRSFNLCYNPNAQRGLNMSVAGHCSNPQIRSLFQAEALRLIELRSARERQQSDLEARVSEELLKAAFEIDDDTSERYVWLDEKSPQFNANSWWNEIRGFYEDSKSKSLTPEGAQLLKDYVSQFEKAIDFQASFDLKASGVIVGRLVPDTSRNKNNWRFDNPVLDEICEQINSANNRGEGIVLRDSHEKSLRSILGYVTRASRWLRHKVRMQVGR